MYTLEFDGIESLYSAAQYFYGHPIGDVFVADWDDDEFPRCSCDDACYI